MPVSKRHSTLIALLVAGAFYMENLDGTVIATALPQMARSFGTNAVALSTGMSAYLFALAVFIPISGWVADRFGARTVFGSALGVFTVASVLCGCSQNVWQFTAARVLQGIGGAMMVPVGRLVVLRNTETKDLMRTIALIVWPGLVAPVIGPPLGGFITTYTSWRWIFFLNVPLGILGIVLTMILIRNDRSEKRPPLDAIGFVLSGVSCTTLMYGIDLISSQPTPWPLIGMLLVASAFSGLAAVWHAGRHPHPLLDLAALRIPTFSVTIFGGSMFRVAIFSAPFLLPLMFQIGFGLTPFASGLLVLAVFAGNLSMKPLTTPVLKRFGFRTVLLANGVFTSLGLLACAFLLPGTPRWIVVVVLFAGGLSRSMQFTSLTTLAFAEVPPAKLSAANTLYSTVQQMTMAMGIAFGAVALQLAGWLHRTTGANPSMADFRLAFVIVALLAAFALFDSARLDRAAGRAVSGHGVKQEPEPAPAQPVPSPADPKPAETD